MVYRVRVTDSDPSPERYRWEIVRIGDTFPVERSKVSFRIANTALKAGERALARFLKQRARGGAEERP